MWFFAFLGASYYGLWYKRPVRLLFLSKIMCEHGWDHNIETYTGTPPGKHSLPLLLHHILSGPSEMVGAPPQGQWVAYRAYSTTILNRKELRNDGRFFKRLVTALWCGRDATGVYGIGYYVNLNTH